MRHNSRPNSQGKPKSIQMPINNDKMVLVSIVIEQQSIISLKQSLMAQKQSNNRWSQHESISPVKNDAIANFLTKHNLQQYYKQVCQLCHNDYQQLLLMKQLSTTIIPTGHILKLQKAINSEIKQSIPKQSTAQITDTPSQACCWICYKLLFDGLEYYGKVFCSTICRDAYQRENYVKCRKCTRNITKFEAINSYGEWFCSQKCVFTEEEMLMELVRQSKFN